MIKVENKYLIVLITFSNSLSPVQIKSECCCQMSARRLGGKKI